MTGASNLSGPVSPPGLPKRTREGQSPSPGARTRPFRCVVIGGGQAGLSAAYYLRERGLSPWVDFIVLDRSSGPGGAWRERWDSLTIGGTHRIHPLPNSVFPAAELGEPANQAVPRYYGDYEVQHQLPVVRPARVISVSARTDPESGTSLFELRFEGDAGESGVLFSRSVINATGTWNSPFIPHYPGIEGFPGLHLHARDYKKAQDFEGSRVLVVGGGTSAVQFVQELARSGAKPIWSTRSTPRWTTTLFDDEWGSGVEKSVSARTVQGLRPLSVVAATGIPLAERYLPDIESGLLISRGRLIRFEGAAAVLDGPQPEGRGFPDQGEADPVISEVVRNRVRRLPGTEVSGGWRTPVDAVLWATGFRQTVRHLSPLGLRSTHGGIEMAADDVSVPAQPGLFLTGYGASASTRGAVRAGRRAAIRALRFNEA